MAILPDNEFYTFEDREVWKDIPGWDGLYQASTLGRIKRLRLELIYSDGQKHFYPEKIYKFPPSGNGYYVARLRRPGEDSEAYYVHRLVAETFLEKPDGCDVVNHIDSDRTNNRVDNLEWTTKSGNSIHAIHQYGKIGAIEMKPVVCEETGCEFESSADAARWLKELTTNIKASASNIHQAASGNRPTALGFHWKFKEEN